MNGQNGKDKIAIIIYSSSDCYSLTGHEQKVVVKMRILTWMK